MDPDGQRQLLAGDAVDERLEDGGEAWRLEATQAAGKLIEERVLGGQRCEPGEVDLETEQLVERSARRLAWCEALTLLPHAGASDELFDELCCHFTQEQIVALTLAINAWSRLNVGVRTPVADAIRAAQPEAA